MKRLLAATVIGVLTSGASLGAASDDALSVGIRQLAEGDIDQAVITLDGAVRRLSAEPGHESQLATADLYLGLAHLSLSQVDKARNDVREALKINRALTMDPAQFPPPMVKLFSEVKAELAKMGLEEPTEVLEESRPAAPPPPVAQRPATAPVEKRGGGGKVALLVVGGGAAAAGVALAVGGGGSTDNGSPTTVTTTPPTTVPAPSPTPTPTPTPAPTPTPPGSAGFPFQLLTSDDTSRSFDLAVGKGPLKARLSTASPTHFLLVVQQGGTVLGQSTDLTPFEVSVTAAAGRCTIKIQPQTDFRPIQGEVDVTFQRP